MTGTGDRDAPKAFGFEPDNFHIDGGNFGSRMYVPDLRGNAHLCGAACRHTEPASRTAGRRSRSELATGRRHADEL
jgi:hypothetical protein